MKTIEFNLTDINQCEVFANLCAALNNAGVCYSLLMEERICRVALTIN